MASSKDVAKLAQVSQTTVSRVLNNPDKVSPSTRRKVLHAMRKLNYRPNLIARSLVTKNTKTIALFAGTLNNNFYVEITQMIVDLLHERDYKTMVFFEEEVKRLDNIDDVINYKVDGILLSSIMLQDPIYEVIKKSNIPYMFFNRRPENGNNYVELDNERAGELITQYMIDLGHERIGYISGFFETISTFYDRKLGFEKTLRKNGMQINNKFVHFIDTSSSETARVTKEMMESDVKPTCIICVTDAIALDCLNTLKSLGYKVPDDVSVTGIDNLKISAHEAISLTTVDYDKKEMARISVDNLIDMINSCGETITESRRFVLQPKLVIRNTTKSYKQK